MATKREIEIAEAIFDKACLDELWCIEDVIDGIPHKIEEERKEFEEKFTALMGWEDSGWFKRFHLNTEEYDDVMVDTAWGGWKLARGIE